MDERHLEGKSSKDHIRGQVKGGDGERGAAPSKYTGMGGGGYALQKEVESGLYWRYVEFQLPGDIQTEMLVKQLEIGIWNPKREVSLCLQLVFSKSCSEARRRANGKAGTWTLPSESVLEVWGDCASLPEDAGPRDVAKEMK